MKVDIWSDFVCPFCYIGKQKFERALAQFAHNDKVEVSYKCFELDPNSNSIEFTNDVLARKYGMTVEKAKEMSTGVANQAAEVGLKFNFENMYNANTFDAHRLLILAQEQGLASQYVAVVFEAYFTHNKRISDHTELTKLAVQAGLSEADVQAVLNSNKNADFVRQDEQQANSLGVSGVPFFVINNKYAISGAQPESVFLNALNQIWAENNPTLVSLDGEDTAGQCGPDGCEIN